MNISIVFPIKLCLGSVQFGMKYGVNNAIGRKPTHAEVSEIIKVAGENGIDVIDTASVYGDAEQLIGLSNTNNALRIITKLCPQCDDSYSFVIAEVKKSCLRLNTENLFCLMVHHADDWNKQNVRKALVSLKEKRVVKMLGVSVYTPEEALRCLESPYIDCIQIPYNVLDRRFDQHNVFEVAAKQGKKIFSRSSFLQGLLLMNYELAEKKVKNSGAYIRRFGEIAKSYGFSVKEAALLFCCNHPGISYVVIGVDTVSQLRENIISLKRINEFQKCYSVLFEEFNEVPEVILMPNKWV